MFNKLSSMTILITSAVALISILVGTGLPALLAAQGEIGYLLGGQAAHTTRVAGTPTALPTATGAETPRAASGIPTGRPIGEPLVPIRTAPAPVVVATEPSPTQAVAATTTPTGTPMVEEPLPTVPSPTPSMTRSGQVIIVVAEGLNARSGRGVSYSIPSELRRDDVAVAVATNPSRSWVKILLPGGPAWVNARYVQLVASQDLPIEEAP